MNNCEQRDDGYAHNWQWLNATTHQHMDGITEARARGYAIKHGGTAEKMHDEQPWLYGEAGD